MTTATHHAARDTFITYDEDAKPANWRRWVELLESDPKGLARIGIEVWKGSGGYTEIGELICSTKEGATIDGAGDVAIVDAPKVAEQAWRVCERHHRQHAYERYRLRLYYVRKKGQEPQPGEAVAVKFRDGSPDSAEPVVDGAVLALKVLQKENSELRGYVRELLSSDVARTQAVTANMMTGIRIVQIAALEREQASTHLANLQRQASPADINARFETVMNGIVQTATRLGPFIPYMTGRAGMNGGSPPPGPGTNGAGASSSSGPKPPPPPPPPNGSNGASSPGFDVAGTQSEFRSFFDELDGTQKDKLRDGLPPGAFATIAEIIHGETSQFAAELPALKVILQEHTALLFQTLTPEQLERLQKASA